MREIRNELDLVGLEIGVEDETLYGESEGLMRKYRVPTGKLSDCARWDFLGFRFRENMERKMSEKIIWMMK